MSRTDHPRKWGSHQALRCQRDQVTTRERAADLLAQEILDGIREFEDTRIYWDRPLDYVTRAFLHVWHAKEDTRHIGRRAVDRTRKFVRPGAFQKFMKQWMSDAPKPWSNPWVS